MRLWPYAVAGIVVLLTIASFTLSGWERPPIETVQQGYRGTGMAVVYNPREVREELVENQVPPPPGPRAPDEGTRAGDVYQNVQVLGDLSAANFSRLMTAITQWVSPEQGCTYCHASEANFAADDLYTKIVSRKMIQMTRDINGNWDEHVGNTGVTCYTCHRGQNVPEYVWYTAPAQEGEGFVGNRAGQNMPASGVGLTSLPLDPFEAYLSETPQEIGVVSETALPEGNRTSIKQTEQTYALMMHMSKSLGVNCTYCHNSRSFMSWPQSSPQRQTAWYGLRMTAEINNEHIEPIEPHLPAYRLGPLGDVPKTNCTTCHQGVYKPLYGAPMLDDFPSLAGTPQGDDMQQQQQQGSDQQARLRR